ncbi:hypothetical protein BU042_05565 [Staphylococcus simulans]|uniref:hypothetical protein n=1 Tax=Staphylococcus simulans TaxID=1286 RepID=UPI000D09CBA0|nr:hypothetical protein [Staphylococcus simulans]AVO03191.1 hypothetical protein BI282_12585 [Staphylococcus simulans]AVO06146.1 hypothetical protein BI283_12600 [Staphylococcus simulans]AWG19739.1 hypothetical protein A9958_12590 [Staphylococcus simulans]AWI02687.1 hypothetical protein A7X73_12480 [Staphylococcus simulans]PTJ00424.1 hypothetical protein BU048_02315 [Staphylococcus simulans]
MKKNILTAISTIMLFIPWTILPLRTNAWALESPAAEIMISIYAVIMIFSGIFTIIFYFKARVQNNLMKFCLVVNSLYAVFGFAVLGMIVIPKII